MRNRPVAWNRFDPTDTDSATDPKPRERSVNAPDEDTPQPEESAPTGGDGGRSVDGGETSAGRPSPVSHGMVPPGSTGPGRSTRSAAATLADELDEEFLAYAEDETRRNDFVIRWAVILLAFLVASTPIVQSIALVHVRTGEYLLRNGILPPRTDVFSYTTADRTWANTGWLFDLMVAGVHAIGGFTGLTVLKAVLAAITLFLVVHTVRPGRSTWWSSICAAIAVMVCPLRFSALPESITLLGLACVLWLLVRWRQSGASPWPLVPVFLVWANMDDRMFLGLAVLVLYGVGELVSGALASPAAFETGDHRRTFWMVTAACVVASLVNPFVWETLLAPVKLYGIHYPTMRSLIGAEPSYRNLQYYPMTTGPFWQQLDIAGICGLFLLGSSFVAAALNHRRLDAGALFVLAGFAAFAVAATHELAAAAIVAAVLGSLAAVDSYADRPGANRITRQSLAFARAGRAFTVIGLIGVAVLAMSGRLAGTPRLPLGFGLDPALANEIEGLEATLERIPDEYRGFHGTVRQGDLLVWLGRPTFVDGRTMLHGVEPSTYDTFLELQDRMEEDLATRERRPEASVLDVYGVDYSLAVLRDVDLPTESYGILFASPLWILVELGGNEAVFGRYVQENAAPPAAAEDGHLVPAEERNAYLRENAFDPAGQAFAAGLPVLDQRADTGHARSSGLGWLFPDDTPATPRLQRARTLFRNVGWAHQGRFGAEVPIEIVYGFTYLTLLESNRALVRDSQQAEAYALLGKTHWYLAFELEPKSYPPDPEAPGRRPPAYDRLYHFRRVQALNELSQAIRIDPDNLAVRWLLFVIHGNENHYELSLENAREVARLATDRAELGQVVKEFENVLSGETEERLLAPIEAVRKEADDRLADKQPKPAVAEFCARNGCNRYGLEILESAIEADSTLQNDLKTMLLYASLLLEAGELDQARRVLGLLEQNPANTAHPDWVRLAAIAEASAGRHQDAIELLGLRLEVVTENRREVLFSHLPLVAAPPGTGTPDDVTWIASWPMRVHYGNYTAGTMASEIAELETMIMLLEAETRRIEEARELAGNILVEYFGAKETPLVLQYGRMLGTRIELPKGAADPEAGSGDGDADREKTEDTKEAGGETDPKSNPGPAESDDTE